MKNFYTTTIAALLSLMGVTNAEATENGKFSFCDISNRPQFVSARKFVLNSDIKLFQFAGENLTTSQREINAQLMKIKDKWVADFADDLKFYFYDFEEFKEYICELEIKSDVLLNTPKIFSCINRIYAYHHGANGCQNHVEALNFLVENGHAKTIKLEDVVKDGKVAKLLSVTVDKIAILNKLDYLKNSFTEAYFAADAKEKKSITSQVQFALTPNSIVIIFPAYTIAAGCEGILSCELKYKDITELLNMNLYK